MVVLSHLTGMVLHSMLADISQDFIGTELRVETID